MSTKTPKRKSSRKQLFTDDADSGSEVELMPFLSGSPPPHDMKFSTFVNNMVQRWKHNLEDIFNDDNNKISKGAAAKIRKVFFKMEGAVIDYAITAGQNESRQKEHTEVIDWIDQRLQKIETEIKSPTYAEKAKNLAPKIGNKIVSPTEDKTLMIFPTDQNQTDSEATKRQVQRMIAPTTDRLQIKSFRTITKGGVIIETGTTKTTKAIREAAKGVGTIKVVEQKKGNPKLKIFDLDGELTDKEFLTSLYAQNLADEDIDEDDDMNEIRICQKLVNKRNPNLKTWVIECPSKIRNILKDKGRIYIEYASCRVDDYISVACCFKCQGYGHVEKYCRREGGRTCFHCGGEGHTGKDCPNKGKAPTCPNCKAAKHPAQHRVGTRECPMYTRALERLISQIKY